MKPNRQTGPSTHPVGGVTYISPNSIQGNNGLRLFTFHSPSQDLLRLEFMFENKVNSEDNTVLNNVLLQMLKEGTKKYSSSEIAEHVDFYGAFLVPDFGMDYSTLTLYVLNKHLDKILPVIHSILTEAVFPQKELDTFINNSKQRLLVALEKNSVLARKYLFENSFGSNRYGHIIDIKSFDSIKRSDLKKLYSDQITPSNCTLFASGNINKQVLDTISSFFLDNWTEVQLDSKTYFSSKPQFNLQEGLFISEARENSVQSSIRLGICTIDRTHADFPAFQFLNTVYGGYFGSRLMRNIREDKGYTYGIQSSLSSLKYLGLYMISTDVGLEYTEATMHEIELEMYRLKNDLIDQKELDLVRNYLLGSILASVESIFSHADKFKNVYFSGLDLKYYDYYNDQIHSMTPQKLRDISEKYFDFERLNKVIVGKEVNSKISNL